MAFLGRVANADLPALYGCADVFAMACRSRWGGLEQEGFGIVFVEAAACGVPQVAGDSGGAAEAVDDGVTGLVVRRPDDAGEVAAAFEALLDDDALRASMADGVASARRRRVLLRRPGPSPRHSARCVVTMDDSRPPATSSSAPTSPAPPCSPSPRRWRRSFFTTFWQWVAAVTALALFAIGVFAFLWSYYNAVQRSRRDEIGVAQLYLLLGPPTPPRVRRHDARPAGCCSW